MSGPYNIYPAVDAEYNFPPEIRSAFIASSDVQAALDGARDAGAIKAGNALTGVINIYAGSIVPAGWLLCDGSAIDRATYPQLFAAIGTLYGVGDGTSTFNLPNLKGRVVVGVDASQTEFQALATTGGEKTHQLTVAEMPSHTHVQNAHGHSVTDPGHSHTQASHGHGVNDPGHGHGISDPGHGHPATSLDGFITYQTATAVRRQVALDSSSGNFATTSSPTNAGLGYGAAANSGTGISINGSGTGLSIQTSQPTISSSSTGLSVQNTTGTNQTTGGDGGHNVLQPYMAMKYIIHV